MPPRDAFLRRSGYTDPETGEYHPRGKSHTRHRAESLQYTAADPRVQRVRGYRRRYPHPPGKTRGKLRVRAYFRHAGARDWLAGEYEREWTDYRASYYNLSRKEARKMVRDSRP